MQTSAKRLRFFLLLSLVLTYVLMVFGGIVTSTGSGLGCPDWPLCHGQLLPFQLKEQIPTPPAPLVAPTPLQPWIEQIHRILGGITGLVLLATLYLSFKEGTRFVRKALVFIFIALVFEALLGMRVVVTEAPLLRELLDYVYTTSHLILSVFILSTLTVTYYYVKFFGRELKESVAHADGLFVATMFQILLGIFVRYVKALEYNEFVYYLHITYAGLLVILSLFILFKTPNREAVITLFLMSAQILAGVATVISGFFLPYLFIHIAVGFLIVVWVSYLVAPSVLKTYKEFRGVVHE
ncbi:MAG: heme A synthase [Aquificae bacterium]|nr:heme A synthase [Aquificota bacterium]